MDLEIPGFENEKIEHKNGAVLPPLTAAEELQENEAFNLPPQTQVGLHIKLLNKAPHRLLMSTEKIYHAAAPRID